MRHLAVLVLFMVFYWADCASMLVSGDKYTTRYDNIDIENILKSERLLQSYHRCITDGVGCTAEGRLLRDAIPDALHTDCAKCSDVQRKQAGRVIAYLIQYRPDYWNKLLDKFDPEGKFRKKYGYETDDDEDYEEEEDAPEE